MTTRIAAGPSVAVVGAGISGLVTAHSLHACGLEVKVFDKGRGPGGRMSTRRHEASRGAFDHGAQYFTARDPCFQRYVDSWVTEGVVAPWAGRLAVVRDGRAVAQEDGLKRMVGVPSMSAVARHLASDLDVVYRTWVDTIERRGRQWHLTTDDDTSLGDFGAVVVSTPPAQATSLLAGAPELGAKAEAVTMAPCWAVMAAFDRELELPFDGGFVEESPLSWIARNNSKPGRPSGESWVLHGSPEWSVRRLESRPDEVSARLLRAFFEATRLRPRAPLNVRAHRWRYSLAKRPLDTGCLWDRDLRIGACGDWCSGSRVEGAFLSGLAIAGRVLRSPV